MQKGNRTQLQLVAQAGPLGFQKLAVVKRSAPIVGGRTPETHKLLVEAQLSSAVNHPNLVHTYASAVDTDGAFLVMEYLPGQNLSSLLARLDLNREGVLLAFKILIALLEGLESVHTARSITGQPLHLVHQGVTWENVQLTYDGRVKLVDFGSASSNNHRTPHRFKPEDLRFCAPELLKTGQGDRRADLYSVGVLLWELCSGSRLHNSQSADSLRMMMTDGRNVSAPPLKSIHPWLPVAIQGICAHALATDPSQRYASAERLRGDLKTLLSELGETNLDCCDDLSRELNLHFAAEKTAIEVQVSAALSHPLGEALKPTIMPPTQARGSSAGTANSAMPSSALPFSPFADDTEPPTTVQRFPIAEPISGSQNALPRRPLDPPKPWPLHQNEDTEKSPQFFLATGKNRIRLIGGAIVALLAVPAFALWFTRTPPEEDVALGDESKTGATAVDEGSVPEQAQVEVHIPPAENINLQVLKEEAPEQHLAAEIEDEQVEETPTPRPRVYPKPRAQTVAKPQQKTSKNAAKPAAIADQKLEISRSISWE